VSQTTALGSGPIRVITSNGDQLLVPLSAIIYDEAHTPDPYYVNGYDEHPEVQARINHLVEIGELRRVEPPPPTPAMLLESLLPAPRSDAQVTVTHDAQVTISYDSGMTSFSFEVTVTNTYAGLTKANILSVLGLGATGAPGTSPGLAHIQPTSSPRAPVPATGTPDVPRETTTDVQFAPGGTNLPSFADIMKDDTHVAFTLDAWKPGSDGNKTKARIKDIVEDADPNKTTFTLELVWTHTKASLSPTSLQTTKDTINTEFGYVLKASAPPGGTLAAPRSGTFSLGGGMDLVPAKALLSSM
jgi:hypothetical protein